jgi:hypothetical protein
MPEQFSTHAAEPAFQLAFEDPDSYEFGIINIAGSGSEPNAYGINTDPTPVQVTQDVVYGRYVLPAVMVRYRTVLGSILASFDTMESEGRQMKQC